MTPSNPFAAIELIGNILIRGVTLALPIDRVRGFLPPGLELGPQDVTPDGTHPVLLMFNDNFRGHWSIPSLVPNMTYREHTIGVPFSYISSSSITSGCSGPFNFMPKLYLDNAFAFVGGVLFYGFPKEIASFNVTAEQFAVSSLTGQLLTSLHVRQQHSSKAGPVAELAHFEPVRQMLMQPLITRAPMGIGPFFTLCDFIKTWDHGTLQPVEAAVQVNTEILYGFPAGRYPAEGFTRGIDSGVLGSYELRTPYRLSLPYSPLLSTRR